MVVPPKDGYFPIASINRSDMFNEMDMGVVESGNFLEIEHLLENIPDERMIKIAHEMGINYIENGSYWEDLQSHVEDYLKENGIKIEDY